MKRMKNGNVIWKGVIFLANGLPKRFKIKMKQLLATEAEEFFSTYSQERTAGLRINPLKIDKEKWEKLNPFPLEPVPYTEYGYYYPYEEVEPGKHPYHYAGLYYIQEPSAMFVAGQLDAKPGEKILDLCAAPGGKSTQIAAAMNGAGILVTNDVHPKRARALSENIERSGITNAIVLNETPERLAAAFSGYFDKILVDAPCSGEGMFRKDPETIQYWSEDHVIACSVKQLDILKNAYTLLKEGGIIVYSTCTFSPEENEQVIEQLLALYPDLELLEIPKREGIAPGRTEWTETGLEEIQKCARLWPHRLKGEGHFVAKLKKTAPAPQRRRKKNKSGKSSSRSKEFQSFVEQYLQNITFTHYQQFGNQLYAVPADCPDLSGLKVLRWGLHLGELKKNRFEPNHALALALTKNEVKQTVDLSSREQLWLDYMKGMTLPGTGTFSGWVLITVDGFSLGWGKEAGGMIKNFYPKGLRIQS